MRVELQQSASKNHGREVFEADASQDSDEASPGRPTRSRQGFPAALFSSDVSIYEMNTAKARENVEYHNEYALASNGPKVHSERLRLIDGLEEAPPSSTQNRRRTSSRWDMREREPRQIFHTDLTASDPVERDFSSSFSARETYWADREPRRIRHRQDSPSSMPTDRLGMIERWNEKKGDMELDY